MRNPFDQFNIFWCFVAFIVALCVNSFFSILLEEKTLWYLLYVMALFPVVKLYFSKRRGISIAQIFGSIKMNIPKTILYLIILVVVDGIFADALLYMFSFVRSYAVFKYMNEDIRYVLTPATFINLVIVVPVLEELFFRGVLLNISKGRSIKTMLLLSSFIFGIGHYEWFLPVGISAYFCGYIYIKKRSLFPCIFFHSAANFRVFLYRIYGNNSDLISLEQIRSDTFNSFLIFLLILPIMIYFLRKSWKDLENFESTPYIKNA